MAGICRLLGPNMSPPGKKAVFARQQYLLQHGNQFHELFSYDAQCVLVGDIYIYISFVFAVAAAFRHGETKYAKRSEETEWILGALIPTQSYMCCSKLNTVFEMISDGSYTTNRRQIALLS